MRNAIHIAVLAVCLGELVKKKADNTKLALLYDI